MGKPFYGTRSLWLTIVFPGSSILAIGTNGISSTISHVNGRAFFETHHDFCLSIHIPVVANDVLLVVLEVTHIRATVHPPEHGTILLQASQHGILLGLHAIDSWSILWIELSTLLLIIELHQDFHLAIAIHIGAAGIVRLISSLERLIVLDDNFLIVITEYSSCFRSLLLYSIQYRLHGILTTFRTRSICKVRYIQWFSVYPGTISIEIVLHIVILIGLDTP